jgi:ubiquinone biosynthesis protein
VDELTAAVRTVCEPYFTRPLSQISLAELVVKLFRTAQKFELTLQPQLILLQKTLLNIEGVGRMLDPDIDIWAVAHPVLERILRERYSPRRTLRAMRQRLPEWFHAAPQFPELVRDALRQIARGERRELVDPLALMQQAELARRQRRALVAGLLGVALLGCATALWLAKPMFGPMWPAGLSLAAGAAAFIYAVRR